MAEAAVERHALAHDFVEEMGLFFKNLGVARAAGQMFGFLMVCDPREQSAGQISEAIGVSPASVSTNVRLLMQMGAIEPTTRRSDRKTFYRLRSDFWIEMAIRRLTAFDQIAATGEEVIESGELTRTDGIKEMLAFSAFWHRELPGVTERWDETRRQSREDR